jgi:hypothetical protein
LAVLLKTEKAIELILRAMAAILEEKENLKVKNAVIYLERKPIRVAMTKILRKKIRQIASGVLGPAELYS